ncbi:MAG TPA: hypothetical protein VEU47_06605 [Candidatus Cybelea sp.]|nr:hypothetical protein [Candidatus Cybelea sp.]
MRLKTYHAPTMSEAMRLVRVELGDEAVIVSSYRSRRGRGVEVTAAIEPRDAATAAPVAMNGAAVKSPTTEQLAQSLAYHAVPEDLAERLRALALLDSSDPLERRLATALASELHFDPLPAGNRQPLVLVGAPGAGKTVAVAKLATRAVMAGRSVAVITCDTVRAGGVEQLSAFVELLGQPLVTVAGPEELCQAIAEAAERDTILIDTPGTNPLNAVEIADLQGFLAAGGNAHNILVLPAGLDGAEATDAARQFAEVGARRLLITRLDVARRYGAALAAAKAAGMSLDLASSSSFVAQGLHALTPGAVARLLLRNPAKTDLAAVFSEDSV